LKKIFLTGIGGQLGLELSKLILFNCKEYELIAPRRSELDLADHDLVLKIILEAKPDIIIHTAAYTNVVQAEQNKDLCYLGNVIVTNNLIEASKLVDAVFVYLSTDFVFDGRLDRPYNVHDLTNPLNYYGETKLMAEEQVRSLLSKFFIIRTSWLFSSNEGNFMTKVLQAAKQNIKISVVQDEIGSPTSTIFLSKVILKLIDDNQYGTYHVSNYGSCSRYEFASKIVEKSKVICDVMPMEGEFKSSVIRPKYTVLDNNWYFRDLSHQSWTDAIDEVMESIGLL
jgi:dTDP-4-dehydrorhamnose reductase